MTSAIGFPGMIRVFFAVLLVPGVALAQSPSHETLRLPADALASVSVNGTSLGTVSNGSLDAGHKLARDGLHHGAVLGHRRRRIRYGTQELVSLIREASAQVAQEFPGTVLRTGNLSLRGGGDLRASVSHNSGRDADLAFFALDGQGEPATARHFVHFNGDGRSRGSRADYFFDVARNWALVKALLTNRSAGADVQFLFISEGLRQSLLDYGTGRGDPPELMERAASVLRQPTGSLPHDDHLHLRIYCSLDDRLDGCLDYGPRWDWIPRHTDALRRRVLAIAEALHTEKRSVRRLEAIRLLEAIRERRALPWLVEAAGPTNSRKLRLRALKALRTFRDQSTWPRLGSFLTLEKDPVIAAALLDTLAVTGDTRTWPWIATRLDDKRKVKAAREQEPRLPASRRLRWEGRRRGRESLGARAARSLGHTLSAGAVPLLIESLGSKDRVARWRSAQALQRITNQRPGAKVRWKRKRLSRKAIARGQKAWRGWWMSHADMSRDEWLQAGFVSARSDFPKDLPIVSDGAAPALLKAAHGKARHIAHNARHVLRRIAGLRPWRPGEPLIGQKWWKRWWRRHSRDRVAEAAKAPVGLRASLKGSDEQRQPGVKRHLAN